MKETKLLNCPFCGGKARLEFDAIGKGKYLYSVSCADECVTQNRYYDTAEEAIKAWNTRKPMERIIERLETLAEKHMSNSEKAAELGKAYEKHMILNGAKGMAFEDAIEIIKEEGGIE